MVIVGTGTNPFATCCQKQEVSKERRIRNCIGIKSQIIQKSDNVFVSPMDAVEIVRTKRIEGVEDDDPIDRRPKWNHQDDMKVQEKTSFRDS